MITTNRDAVRRRLDLLVMPKFRKKPVEVEASQYFKDGDHPLVEHCYFTRDGRVRWAPGDPPEINVFDCHKKPAIRTLEGWHEVTPGDWIITGVNGEHYPCKPDIFEKTYEPVRHNRI